MYEVTDEILKKTQDRSVANISDAAKENHENVYRGIGRVIIASGVTESLMIHLFGRLLNTSSNNAHIVYYSLQSARAKRDMIENLAHENLKGPMHKRCLTLIKRFNFPNKVRNELAHCEYKMDPKTRFFFEIATGKMRDYKGGDPVIRKPMDKKWLKQVEDSITNFESLNRDLWKFFHDFDNKKNDL